MSEENNSDGDSYKDSNHQDVVQESPESVIKPQDSGPQIANQGQIVQPTAAPSSLPAAPAPKIVSGDNMIMPQEVGQQTSYTEQDILPSQVPVNSAHVQQSKITSDNPSLATPTQHSTNNDLPSITSSESSVVVPNLPKKSNKINFKKIGIIFPLVLLFVIALYGAYLFGKKNERIVFQLPPPKPINLPPQAVVFANCTPGRGKQYILPKDIPLGPIYDVVNSKVIAIEYNLSLSEIQSNPDSLSNTILQLAREYPVDHFSIVPVATKVGDPLASIHLVMFVVSKDEANSIQCDAEKSP